ncbi:DNA repair protein RecN [Gammaproteobacteria bacterium]|nr:DNA repair protein RecN [Gammaproteobacteria bacterium]
MLQSLSIRNLAVVESLDFNADGGLNIITGETGAGKSILLQGLNLLLGQRADIGLIRSGNDRAEVTAIFEINQNISVRDYLSNESLDEGDDCILRRIITSDGKSKAFINGRAVTLSSLRDISRFLVDIHGQNEHHLLLNPLYQLEIYDSYQNNQELLENLGKKVVEYRDISQRIEALKSDGNDKTIELLTFHCKELETANLNQEELDSIEERFKLIKNSGKLIESITNIAGNLSHQDGPGYQLDKIIFEIEKATDLDPNLAESLELLKSAQIQIQETQYNLENYLSSIDIDPETFKSMENRISFFYDLCRKHDCEITELIGKKNEIEKKLALLSDSSKSLEELVKKQEKIHQEYISIAKELSAKRQGGMEEFSQSISNLMQELGMKGSVFHIRFDEQGNGVHSKGNESIEFLVQTNLGQDMRPLRKIASGGELSRVSLAIAVSTNSDKNIPTLVYDEVDVGISGAVASSVGEKLKQLSKNNQIICITHLAQVASYGNHHFKVNKIQQDAETRTSITKLTEEERRFELARILSGAKVNEKSLAAASELIQESA